MAKDLDTKVKQIKTTEESNRNGSELQNNKINVLKLGEKAKKKKRINKTL